MAGRPVPGDQGDRFRPQGIKTYDVGPKSIEGKGVAECDAETASIRNKLGGGKGCPMAFGKI